jgi:hypothetical protein
MSTSGHGHASSIGIQDGGLPDTGWLAYGLTKILLGQYQLAGARDAQTVFFVIMKDHDFVPRTEQYAAAEPGLVVVRGLVSDHIAVPGFFNIFHCRQSMINGRDLMGLALFQELRGDLLPMFEHLQVHIARVRNGVQFRMGQQQV